MLDTKVIYRLAGGWYNFEDIPQGYIKIHNLACGTDRKALNQARRMNSKFEYEIQDISEKKKAATL